ncbi:hypothetical protein QUA52_13405 [Microcoleus sp. N9_A3]
MNICNLVRTYARVVRNRVFDDNSWLHPTDSVKNPVSWGLMRQEWSETGFLTIILGCIPPIR